MSQRIEWRFPIKPFKIGIDSYSLRPLELSPFEVLDWAIMNDAEGVQFSGGSADTGQDPDKALLEELSGYGAENRLYLEWGGGEYIPFDSVTGKPKDILAINKKAAEQARLLGTEIVRSSAGGLMRSEKKSPPAEDLLRAVAKSLKEQQGMLQDLGVILALETQFALTSYEFLRIFDMIGTRPGEHFGICLDTMNLLAMLENPVAAAERLLPWIVTTHVKDGAVLITEDGFVVFPVEAGTGIVAFSSIFEKLASLEKKINLSLEDHGGKFLAPVFSPEFLAGLPDLTAAEMAAIVKLTLKSRTSLKEGRISVLDRERWPEHCERRIKRGLRAARKIVGSEEKPSRLPSHEE